MGKHFHTTGLTVIFSILLTACFSIKQNTKIKIIMKKVKASKTTLRHNKSYLGDTIEIKVLKLTTNKEPVRDGAPLIYTDRSQGVPAPYDIRTDRMEEALNLRTAMANKAVSKRGADKKTDIGKKAAEGMKKEGDTPPTETSNN